MENEIVGAKLPILALRGLVLFPGMTLHFDVGRKASINAVKYALDSGKKFSDSKKFMDGVMDGTITDEDCYWVGPAPIIMKLMDQWTEVVNHPDDWIEIEKSNSK